MGVGRAEESERTCSPSCGSSSSVDIERASPTRRRPVRVRRRRSQRRAERGEKSEGGKCQRTIGSLVRGAPPREPIKRAPGPQTIEPISPQCLCPSHRTQHETSPPRRTLPMVGVLFSRCGEGWLWVSQGSSELRGDPPSMAPTHRQRDGAPQKAAHCPYFLRVSGNIFDDVFYTCVKGSVLREGPSPAVTTAARTFAKAKSAPSPKRGAALGGLVGEVPRPPAGLLLVPPCPP